MARESFPGFGEGVVAEQRRKGESGATGTIEPQNCATRPHPVRLRRPTFPETGEGLLRLTLPDRRSDTPPTGFTNLPPPLRQPRQNRNPGYDVASNLIRA